MKKLDTYGVEMTEIENMMFSKYLSNNSFAMCVMTEAERTEFTRLWLKTYHSNKQEP